MPKVISVNIGVPAAIDETTRKRRIVYSGIIKHPAEGPVAVRQLNLDGDKQADLTVHGGVNKAAYVYPSEHYEFWRAIYPQMKLEWGTFGENLTTEGILESDVHVGDRLSIGSTIFCVTEPRFPCYKLGIRFNDEGILKSFLESERSGYYLKVLKEGWIKAGDPISLQHIDTEGSETITSLVRMVKREEQQKSS